MNHQNVLSSLDFEESKDNQSGQMALSVELRHCYGLSGSFKALRASIVSVSPYVREAAMALREHEGLYLQVVQRFLYGRLPVEDFVLTFMDQWREDRDAKWALQGGQVTSSAQSNEFNAAVDQAFTACDSFSHEPRNEFEISEAQLRHELQRLFGVALREARAH